LTVPQTVRRRRRALIPFAVALVNVQIRDTLQRKGPEVRGAALARTMFGCTTVMAMAQGAVARADAPCARVQVSPELPAVWSEAVRELERQIALLPASDCQPTSLVIEPADAGARLVATATDGRRAERTVRHPESLVATALGLVMAIPALPASAPAPTSSSPVVIPATAPPPAASVRPAPSASSPAGSLAVPVVAAAPSAEATTHPLALYVGVDAGGRVAQPTSIAMIDVGLHSDLLLSHWLLTVAIRNTPLGLVGAQGLDRDAFRQVTFGLGFGRRFVAGEAAFDVILEPTIVAMQMEYDYSATVESQGNDVEMSVNGLVRMALPVGKSWALTLTLENDVIPGNLSSVPAHLSRPSDAPAGEVNPPPFPSWQGALRFGVMGALL
jgi:hypothetical protein